MVRVRTSIVTLLPTLSCPTPATLQVIAPEQLVPIAVGIVASQKLAPAAMRLLRKPPPTAPPLAPAVAAGVAAVLERLAALTPQSWRACPMYKDHAVPLLAAAAAAASAPGATSAVRLRAAAALEALRPC